MALPFRLGTRVQVESLLLTRPRKGGIKYT